VTADSLYEAAALGLAMLCTDRWTEAVAPGTALDVQIRQPAATHTVTIAQLRRWCDGIATSPAETLKKRRRKELISGGP
jgi:hypothetical protein